MDVDFILSDASTGNYNNQQQPYTPFQNQMQSFPMSVSHSEAEMNLYFQQRQFNTSQVQPRFAEKHNEIEAVKFLNNTQTFPEQSQKMHIANEPNRKFASNGYAQDSEASLQRQQQQMAVSSPSVSSTADLSNGLASGQNGLRYVGFCGGQQLDSTNYNMQQTTVDDGIGSGDFSSTAQPNLLRQPIQFGAMNGSHLLNGHNGGMCFPTVLPPSIMVPSPNAPHRRTFLFNSDMANNAVKSMQQNLTEDMAGWHLKHCTTVPSTSRAALEPKMTTNNNGSNSSAPRTTNSRGTKRKASAAQSVSDIQQPHSMSLSPRDVRPSSYTSCHPQSAPVMSNHLDQSRQPELCDSSTNSDADLLKGSSGHLQSNGATLNNFIQNGSIGQMDENPLKKMEIMTSKTLNEPTNGRIQRLCSEERADNQNNQILIGAADASKQEKMHKLQEIEKALLPFADTSPSYTNSTSFPDSTQLRPPFFAPPGQMTQAVHPNFGHHLMGSFPQNHPLKMTMMHSNQQMYNSIGEMHGVGSVMMTPAGSSEAVSQQTWL